MSEDELPPTLAKAWVAYKARAIPLSASDEQVLDMLRTFYAGASYIMECMGQAAAMPETAGAVIGSLHEELEQYHNGNIKLGRQQANKRKTQRRERRR